MGITKTNKNDRYNLGYMNNNNVAMQAIIMVLKLVFSLCIKCFFAFDFGGKEGHILFEIHPVRQQQGCKYITTGIARHSVWKSQSWVQQ